MTDLSIDARLLAPDNNRNRSNMPVVAVAAAALLLGALVLTTTITWRQGALFLVGGGLGLSLYHALFGFTSAWRVFIVARRGAGLRAQMVMLAIAVVLFFPALAHGTLFGQPVHGEYGAVSLIDKLGWMPALVLCLVVMAGIYVFTLQVETHSHGEIEPGARTELTGTRRFLQGPWPLLWGAVALALGNFATLYLAGRPWGITSAFALWGSKIAMALGADVASWGYWQGARAASLQQSIFSDITSVMDFGIMLGVLLAAGLAGKFNPTWRLPLPSLLAAIVGGLLLGYGARLAYGCNIGAYFSGIASGSLHGWCWLVAAFIGNIIGTRLRPLFGLTVERGPVPVAKPI
ncbi:membrane hypothetical protein [Bradyrhizobium sp. ORS 375]|uniref:YeeE/YedE family protein n=1 Tax=Bradyrhizobium sp. (strain ORS 375) TaxID=566679 RepID=UPI000240AD08|nr:YeeE/YedE family protein [Bradyrhizobium sp. ORS 375]CCD92307.1 membrane hypothetical protein [Bradyrhizobium sp. ORS 375]